jgi:hypothetical protein
MIYGVLFAFLSLDREREREQRCKVQRFGICISLTGSAASDHISGHSTRFDFSDPGDNDGDHRHLVTRSRTLPFTDQYGEEFHSVRCNQVSRAWSAASSDDVDSFNASASSRCWSPTRDDDDVHVTEELAPEQKQQQQQQQQHPARCSTQAVASPQTVDEFCDCGDDDDDGGGGDASAENDVTVAVTGKKAASSPPGADEMLDAAIGSEKQSANAEVSLSAHNQQKTSESKNVKKSSDSRKTEGCAEVRITVV